MKTLKQIFIPLFLLFFFLTSCSKDEVIKADTFNNELSFPDSSDSHPKKVELDSIIEAFVNKGIIGTSIYVNDDSDAYLGAGGYSDIGSSIRTSPEHQFMIASVSKVFTATAIFSLIDEGLMSINDPVNKWIDNAITDKVDNANESTIGDLLSHTSGIPDYYTTAFEMTRYNVEYNYFSQEEILEFVFDKKANFPVSQIGQTYIYSNTNYLLLGMIAEEVTGQSLKSVYSDRIFNPIGLKNAYFDIKEKAAPATLINGYYNLYGKGYVVADFLYKDELSTGDGGIIINAQDLGVFFDNLMHGNLLSQQSLDKMQEWFDIEEEDEKNGYGLEYQIDDDYGISYGHTGGVDGFTSLVYYYPEQDVTFIFLFNFTPGTGRLFNSTINFTKAIRDVFFN